MCIKKIQYPWPGLVLLSSIVHIIAIVIIRDFRWNFVFKLAAGRAAVSPLQQRPVVRSAPVPSFRAPAPPVRAPAPSFRAPAPVARAPPAAAVAVRAAAPPPPPPAPAPAPADERFIEQFLDGIDTDALFDDFWWSFAGDQATVRSERGFEQRLWWLAWQKCGSSLVGGKTGRPSRVVLVFFSKKLDWNYRNFE